MDAVSRSLDHERIANESKHWVRLTAACNSRCIFCLDSEAQDGRILSREDICRELARGREDKNATRVVLSGGEASIHPHFVDFVRIARDLGYTWIQTVTNGRSFARRDFFLQSVDAGLSEITFSIHGHNAELHDRLTRAPGSFDQIVKAILRAVRDGRVVVNADVVINRQNVEVLERIVALLTQLGVREYDLLHVIPQGEAWEYRDQLFYDVDAYAPALRRVFRLGRNPNFHVWTNRFPVSHLEDMEELIQDPHKMLDEVGGRRRQFRNYLDNGTPIECRHTERCPHCFIEPFCKALDRKITQMKQREWKVWWVGTHRELLQDAPEEAEWWGLTGDLSEEECAALEKPVLLDGKAAGRLPSGSRRIVRRGEDLQEGEAAELWLDKEFCAWLLQNLPLLERNRKDWVLVAPTYLHLSESSQKTPDYTAFFSAIPFGVRAQNLPPCLAPGALLENPLPRLDAALLHADGRLAIDAFVEHYIIHEYRAKSLRCKSCSANTWCQGAQLQHLRHAGFRILRPLSTEVPPLLPPISPLGPPLSPAPRWPVPSNAPVPEIDTAPGRRS